MKRIIMIITFCAITMTLSGCSCGDLGQGCNLCGGGSVFSFQETSSCCGSLPW